MKRVIFTQSKSRRTRAKTTFHWIASLLLSHHSHAIKYISFKDVCVFLHDWKSAFSDITYIITKLFRVVLQNQHEKNYHQVKSFH